MSAFATIPIERIRHRADARHRSDDALEALAESIESVGLINAIRVRRAEDGFEVIAGSHRLQAAELLGWQEIPAFVVDDDDLHAELAMIDENLCRAELSASDRARQTARRKAIYVELHPETAHGANLVGDGVAKFATPENERFTAATAKVTGQSERLVQLNAERGEKVTDEAHALIRGTRLDTGTTLDRLKTMAPEKQVETIKRELAAPPPARTGIAARYTATVASTPESGARSFEAFIAMTNTIEALDTNALIAAAGRQRSVLGQRCSGLIDKLNDVLGGLDA